MEMSSSPTPLRADVHCGKVSLQCIEPRNNTFCELIGSFIHFYARVGIYGTLLFPVFIVTIVIEYLLRSISNLYFR